MRMKFNFKRIAVFIAGLFLLEVIRRFGLITAQIQMFLVPILIVLYFAIGEYLDRNQDEKRGHK